MKMIKYYAITSVFCFAIFACGQGKAENNNHDSNAEKTKEEQMKPIEQSVNFQTNNNTQNKNSMTDQEKVVKSLIDAMAANDAEKIRSSFNENASQAYGDGDKKYGKAFFKWLESDIIERNGHVDNPQYKSDGNEVVVTGQYSSEGYTNKANFLFTVENGEIMSWQMRY